MTLFLLLSAAMVLLALALVLVPLLRSRARAGMDGESLVVLVDGMRELDAELASGALSQAGYDEARLDLERQALQTQQRDATRAASSVRANWAAALATAIALPLIAVLLYVEVGTPAAVRPVAVQAAGGAPHDSGDGAIAALEQRLAANPEDLSGWVLLARSYGQAGRIEDSVAAYRKALNLAPDSPDLLVETANALAISRGRDLSGEPQQLVQRALKLDPAHADALIFAGLAAFQQGDRKQAVDYWNQLVQQLPEGSEERSRIEAFIVRAQEMPASAGSAAGSAARISGTVTIAPEFANRVQPGDTLFVFARAPGGPPMPLAAMRTRADGWPVSFTLDDSSAMAEGLNLSRFERVNLVARISRQGSANPQPGDVEGTLQDVAVGSQDVRVVIDRLVER